MSWNKRWLGTAVCVLVVSAALASPAHAQGRGQGKEKSANERPAVTVELAVSAAREVLVANGFEVVRVEVLDDHQIVYYRAGNQGRGRGHGPPARMIIRRSAERVVVEEAPDGIRLEIGIKLGIKL